MYLKCIEINGFKSFANKINFEFPHGITGIVGPNGSGKSNIADAVRWVLGEQSAKQLRGSKMEDVIFAGTQNRKPLGFAYVAITFDNSDRSINLDYEEVKVARRVYRSGESEYLLNGNVCRRRDIVEIFYDTGIGKEGYSIIGQGQVEKILSGKIEDNRELFDEAAGIAKFKKSRAQTLKTLEKEHENLERVTDILGELESRVGPLKKQSETAKQYLKLKEEEKSVDLSLFVYEVDRLENNIKDSERQYEIVSKDLSETRIAHEKVKEKNEQFSVKMAEVDARLKENETKKDQLNDQFLQTDRDAQILDQKCTSAETMIAHYDEIIQNDTADLESKKEQLSKLNQSVRKLKEELGRKQTGKKTIFEELSQLKKERGELAEEITSGKEEFLGLITSSSDVKEMLGRYDTLEEQLSIRQKSFDQELARLQQDRTENQEQIEETEALKINYQNALDEAVSKEDELTGEWRQIRQNIEVSNNKWQNCNQELLRARSAFETMEAMDESYDGYNRTVQTVMEMKNRFPGIHGVVADIITMDARYETAIEIALGATMSNIITDDDATAKSIISYLKQHKAGRATFLPLSNIRKKNIAINPQILEEPGVIGIASSLVKADRKYDNIIASLLGRTIVTDTVDHALLLNRKNNYSLRIVTLHGELLSPGGAITGGTFRKSANILGRKRELNELKEKIEKYSGELSAIEERLSTLKSKDVSVLSTLDQIRDEISETRINLHKCEVKIETLTDYVAGLVPGIEEKEAALEEIKLQLADIIEKRRKLKKSQMLNLKDTDENSDVVEKLETKLNALDIDIHDREMKLNGIEIDISSLSQRIEFGNASITRLRGEIHDLEDSIQNNEDAKRNILEDKENAGYQLEKLKEENISIRNQLSQAGEELEKVRKERSDLSKEQSNIFTELEEISGRLMILEKEEGRLSGRLEKLNEDLTDKNDYMWEEYEITYHQAKETGISVIKASEAGPLKNRKKEIVREVKSLGSININAIEEYKEVSERYEFLTGQYHDITASEQKLQDMIDQLNKNMKAQFSESFAQIRQMFSTVFADLFEGGTADLELMNTDDILESGIRIVAQPPGKKLVNIMLLSGGERALTAIALLFAIQKLKPSPFCLLDEIEAALDDANIIRFSNYLRRLSEETQYIVITHRRGTMSAADSLYGITMQEKGISSLISVDLIDNTLN